MLRMSLNLGFCIAVSAFGELLELLLTCRIAVFHNLGSSASLKHDFEVDEKFFKSAIGR